MLQEATSNLTTVVWLTVLFINLLAVGLYVSTLLQKRKQPLLERLLQVTRSLFPAASGGTATTVTLGEWALGAPVSMARLASYTGAICLSTLLLSLLLSRSRRAAMVRKQVERANPLTRESGQVLSALQKLSTTTAELMEFASLLKSEAGKNTPTEQSTRISRSSPRKKSPPASSSLNGQKELQDYVQHDDQETSN